MLFDCPAFTKKSGVFFMDEKFSVALSVGVPAIISIIGFIITIFTLKKDFQNELAKQKANIQLDKMSTMPYAILELLQNIIDAGKKDFSSKVQEHLKEDMNKIFSTIYAYGSSTAIHILAAMQSENYQSMSAPEQRDKFRIMSFYVLLTVQIRADITNEIVSPEEWFKMRLTDFQDNREMIKAANNRLVSELNLSNQYFIL